MKPLSHVISPSMFCRSNEIPADLMSEMADGNAAPNPLSPTGVRQPASVPRLNLTALAAVPAVDALSTQPVKEADSKRIVSVASIGKDSLDARSAPTATAASRLQSETGAGGAKGGGDRLIDWPASLVCLSFPHTGGITKVLEDRSISLAARKAAPKDIEGKAAAEAAVAAAALELLTARDVELGVEVTPRGDSDSSARPSSAAAVDKSPPVRSQTAAPMVSSAAAELRAASMEVGDDLVMAVAKAPVVPGAGGGLASAPSMAELESLLDSIKKQPVRSKDVSVGKAPQLPADASSSVPITNYEGVIQGRVSNV